MITYFDKKYSFYELFNEKNGFLIRSNVMHNNIETDISPFMRSFPELLDIGIMRHCHCASENFCKHYGIDCYQNPVDSPRQNMNLDEYGIIINQAKGAVFQIALGGAGDPNKHENFEEILISTKEANIIPNLTTSGFRLSDYEIDCISKYCGAVAVSFYSGLTSGGEESNSITIQAIKKLTKAGCKTNIHFVLHKDNIKEALYRIKNNLFPKGINAVVFLLYKPVGLGKIEKMLSANDKDYIEFLTIIKNKKLSFRYGFDTCQSPALFNFCDFISEESLEFCEAGRFSMYIDSDLKAYPCSFGIDNQDISVCLRSSTIKEAWESEIFNNFRNKSIRNCEKCNVSHCRNCPLDLGINVCGKINSPSV
jgi:MoaA/NifB/PqqE/SkfB family radical SAM enzyme